MRNLLHELDITQLWKELESWNLQEILKLAYLAVRGSPSREAGEKVFEYHLLFVATASVNF